MHAFSENAQFSIDSRPDAPPEGERWSTWDGATHGPKPRPDWVVTDARRRRERPRGPQDRQGGRRPRPAPLGAGHRAGSSTMAAKRYRNGDHRLFHRDAGYLEGRRVRKSREMRAMARRTDFGKQVIAGQWAAAEFDALGAALGARPPGPLPRAARASPRCSWSSSATRRATPRPHRGSSQTRPGSPTCSPSCSSSCARRCSPLAHHGWAHGDLSPYNVLLHEERLVLIDWPQIVDVIGNPRGFEFLERDAATMCRVVRAPGARRGRRRAARRPRRRGDVALVARAGRQ